MDDALASLREAFEEAGYDVVEVTRNHGQQRVVIREEGANADQLRSITEQTISDDELLGMNVTSESIDGQDEIHTVVTVRIRS